MGMYRGNFTRFYLAASKAAKDSDLDYLYNAWYNVYGYGFDGSTPWDHKDPKFRVPAICPKLKTYMLSHGCSATDADRVLKYFKKWYKDSFT